MEIRRRNVAEEKTDISSSNSFENFDVFTKLPSEYKEKSLSGGTMTVITFMLMFLLILIEIWNYFDSPALFTYDVDKDFDSKLRINVDITIAMPCALIGADVVDQGGSTVESETALIEENVVFELSDEGRSFHEYLKHLQKEKRKNFSSLKNLILKKQSSNEWKTKSQLHKIGTELNACRIHGSIYVSKMPGNFHITAGKHVELGFIGGHAHLTGFLSQSDYNFSHIIHHFSFGDRAYNILNPLDSEESIVQTNFHLFQYYIQVVATKIRTISTNINTYQYAVREHNRTIDHNSGSHGMPGIYMRYDISPLQVNVTEDRVGFIAFLVHLSAVIGGLFATSSFLHTIGCGIFESISRKLYGAPSLPLDVKT